MSTPYSYVFVRRDLPLPVQLVQASHAALEAGHKYGEHSHLVLCAVNDEQALNKVSWELESSGIEHTTFFEPDGNVGYTAICTKPLIGDQRKPLKRYQLYR